jgi:hypothetical protein
LKTAVAGFDLKLRVAPIEPAPPKVGFGPQANPRRRNIMRLILGAMAAVATIGLTATASTAAPISPSTLSERYKTMEIVQPVGCIKTCIRYGTYGRCLMVNKRCGPNIH